MNDDELNSAYDLVEAEALTVVWQRNDDASSRGHEILGDDQIDRCDDLQVRSNDERHDPSVVRENERENGCEVREHRAIKVLVAVVVAVAVVVVALMVEAAVEVQSDMGELNEKECL